MVTVNQTRSETATLRMIANSNLVLLLDVDLLHDLHGVLVEGVLALRVHDPCIGSLSQCASEAEVRHVDLQSTIDVLGVAIAAAVAAHPFCSC